MSGYSPLKIIGMGSGLVQNRENFLLPNDAYPVLQNAYVWRERILRKRGYELLGRLQRNFEAISIGNTGASPWTFNLFTASGVVPETNGQIVPGSVQILINPVLLSSTLVAPGYTVASDCEVISVTTAGLYTLSVVNISGVVVVPGSGPDTINGGPYKIELINGTNFKLRTSSQGWGKWQSGGTWTSTAGNINFIDQGDGTLTSTTVGNSGVINYLTGEITLTHTAGAGIATDADFSYYPSLPVMGIRKRELQNSEIDQTVVFDQKYAYIYNSASNQYEEFLASTGQNVNWNAQNAPVIATDFFWSTNYWVSSVFVPGTVTALFTTNNRKLFWVTNNTGGYFINSDPVRITDGVTWISFVTFPVAPNMNWSQIDATTYLTNFLSALPFRGRLVTFNTWEGPDLANSKNYSNRVRWSTIGSPFIPYVNAASPGKSTGSWRDDIRGQGGFLDIPTSEDIVAVGFVRDNLVVYCERSTWQLRYTGNSLSPFQIERVNSEIGAQGPFCSVQFDTSLLAIGDKGIIECDSYKANRIDIKIPDYVFSFQSLNYGNFRIHGIRDFINRLAFWTIPIASANAVFPNQRLVYNYENDSWAIFEDSLTALGTYQPQSSRTWLNTHNPWKKCNFPWKNQPESVPSIIGGNQQGFVEYLDELTTNDVSLFISNIQGMNTTPTVVTSPNHNMKTGFVIGISGIPSTADFENLNGGIFGIQVLTSDTFNLKTYNSSTMQFSDNQLDSSAKVYTGAGLINIRDNFSIVSKKFNFLDEGQNIQLGYLDILMSSTEQDSQGAISLNIYLDYDDVNASNTLPQNQINNGNIPVISDTFFNSVIPTTPSTLSVAKKGTKFWQRVYCATRANFLTLQYTFSNAQMAGSQQEKNVQIDAQILWIRKSGRLTCI